MRRVRSYWEIQRIRGCWYLENFNFLRGAPETRQLFIEDESPLPRGLLHLFFSPFFFSLLLFIFFFLSQLPFIETGGMGVMQFDPREVDLITSSKSIHTDWGMCCFCSSRFIASQVILARGFLFFSFFFFFFFDTSVLRSRGSLLSGSFYCWTFETFHGGGLSQLCTSIPREQLSDLVRLIGFIYTCVC